MTELGELESPPPPSIFTSPTMQTKSKNDEKLKIRLKLIEYLKLKTGFQQFRRESDPLQGSPKTPDELKISKKKSVRRPASPIKPKQKRYIRLVKTPKPIISPLQTPSILKEEKLKESINNIDCLNLVLQNETKLEEQSRIS